MEFGRIADRVGDGGSMCVCGGGGIFGKCFRSVIGLVVFFARQSKKRENRRDLENTAAAVRVLI